jgi:hypothetical protein
VLALLRFAEDRGSGLRNGMGLRLRLLREGMGGHHESDAGGQDRSLYVLSQQVPHVSSQGA